jgi:hypothetical protein
MVLNYLLLFSLVKHLYPVPKETLNGLYKACLESNETDFLGPSRRVREWSSISHEILDRVTGDPDFWSK